jgi:peptidyl-prolyl cis-trans isomerase SurA
MVARLRASLMKFARLILFFAVAIFLAPSSRAALADGVKAIVNDTVITYAQVQDFTAPAAESLQRQYAGQPDAYSQKLSELLNDGLEQLVERELILHDFDVSGYKLPDSVVDELVQDRIRERFGDRVTLMKTLQAQGMTFEEFRKEVRDQWVEAQMRRKNVSQEIIISPYKVENYYQTHQDDFKVEDQIQLRMIVLKKTSDTDTNTLPLANEIITKIRAGATFQEMASVYSQGSQPKESGDWYERSALRKELGDAAFTLKPGQVSDAVETPDSIYIMLVDQVRPAYVKPLGDIRDDIEKTLRTQEQTRIEKQWIEQLKKKAFIRIIP